MNAMCFCGFLQMRLRHMFECVVEAESVCFVCFVCFAHMWIVASCVCVCVCVKPWG